MFYTWDMRIEHDELIELLSQTPILSHLDDAAVNELADLFQPVLYHDGETVFNIGDDPSAFYLVFEGRVVLFIEEGREDHAFAHLLRGDFFGEEALLYDDSRIYRAVSDEETLLLRLKVEDFLKICDRYPSLTDYLKVSVHSRQLSVQVSFPWLGKNETIYVVTRRDKIILWARLFIPLALSLVVGIFAAMLQFSWFPEQSLGWIAAAISLPINLGWLIWAYFDWRNDYFLVTNRRVVWVEKVALIYDSRQEAPLNTIMSVGVEKSRAGSLLGYSDIIVRTYVGMLRMEEVARGEEIANMIESYWHRSESFNRRQESEAMERKLRQKLHLPVEEEETTSEPEFKNPNELAQMTQGGNQESTEPGFFQWLLSDFLRLRYESNGTITYRKHWFILLKTTWMPSLFFMLGMVALISRISGTLTFLPLGPTLLLLLGYLLVVFFWFLYNYVDWRNDIFQVTLDQIVDIDKKPLGKVQRRSAPLESVLSIEYERLGIWGLLFNYGTVYVSVGNTRLTFDHVYNPSDVQQDIFYRMGERLEEKRQFEIESQRERVSEWIASYHRKSDELRDLEHQYPSDEEEVYRPEDF